MSWVTVLRSKIVWIFPVFFFHVGDNNTLVRSISLFAWLVVKPSLCSAPRHRIHYYKVHATLFPMCLPTHPTMISKLDRWRFKIPSVCIAQESSSRRRCLANPSGLRISLCYFNNFDWRNYSIKLSFKEGRFTTLREIDYVHAPKTVPHRAVVSQIFSAFSE